MLAKRNGLITSLKENMPSKAEVRERFFSYWPLFDTLGSVNASVVVNADFSCEAADRLALYLCGLATGLTPNGCTVFEAWQIASKETVWYPTGGGERERKDKERYQKPTLLLAEQTTEISENSHNQETVEVEPLTAASNHSQPIAESFATKAAPSATPTTAVAVEVVNSGIGTTSLPNSTAPITPPTAETKRKYNKRQSLTIAELETAIAALGPEVAKQSRQVANNPEYRANLTEQEITNVKRYWTLAAQLRRRRKAAPQSDQTIQAVAESAIATPIPEQKEVVAQLQMQESEVVAAQTDSFFRL